RHLLGSGLVRLEGLALTEFPLPGETIAQWRQVLEQVIESRSLRTAELALAGPDGERTLACRAAPEPADGQRVESVLCALRETTDARQAFAAMTASEQRFRQLTDRMDDAFWLARRAPPKLLHVNPAAQRLLGVPPRQLLADPAQWRELVHPEDRDGYVDPCRLPDGEMDREYRVCRPDGSEIWVRDRRFLIDEQLGVLAGIAEDITARRERDRLRELHLAQAQQAKAQAEALARAKDEFLAVVSHELRSPLNAIRGWTHVLRQSPSGSTAFAQALAAIERNSALQLTLIEELLDSARVVAGKLLIEPQPTRLDAVIDHAVQAILPTAQARGVTIRVEHDAELDWVEIDGVRFEQVVGNLLSNAVKFTPSGGQVDVRSRARGEMFEIVVRDTGAGINPAFLPHVFDRFRQADSSSTRRTGGLGLGLFLAREIVELHGGRLEVHSEGAGHGAQFTVNAPVGRVQRFRSGSRNEPSDASG
ncbi:MAG TPA: ATP-binding protein, partial [Burkholderiaceae bacterium]|nr:ATP-binding protein [Burkholderiaceae bacterium]